MNTRGAPLIGVVGAYGLALAVRDDASDDHIQKMVEMLAETRPTAINLKWALWRMRGRAAEPAARRARRSGLEGSATDRRRRRGDERSDRPQRSADHPRRSRRRSRANGQHPHPLQCRLAGDGGLRHRAGADLSGA
jgi:hypothetical protein